MPQRVLIPYRHAKKVKPYEEAARAAGIETAPVLTTGHVSLDGFAGLFLMGGTDVNPKRYGEAAQPETDQPDDERDEIELELIDNAIEKDLPILAICRGLQILNVYHGGTLIRHLSGEAERHDPGGNRAIPVHAVTIEPGSLLADIASASCWRVNSSHHQAAAQIGTGLRVSARDSEDGIVEAVERPDKRFVVAVQWHPEDQVAGDSEQLILFRRFGDALRD
jgi:putative glutamine amidotransferase